MRISRAVAIVIAALVVAGARPAAAADSIDPAADFKAFRDYFTKRFPDVPLNDFVNGPYSMDAELRKQWDGDRGFPALSVRRRQGPGNVRHPVQERQDLWRLLCQ